MSTSTPPFARWAIEPIFAFALEALTVRQRKQFLRLLPVSQLPIRFPRRGAPLTSLMEAAVSAAINPARTAARGRARQLESDHRKALAEGRKPIRRLIVREFEDAAQEFLA
jgi:hypothetical protein